ncbi:MAG: phospho-N-acetylmuramoyl-pentapeptide-transferase [SAR324 cluster bacterium]|uniref:Phospho-N-acetylmuramoyl-pentapeptide-transferase n=1 Tax=SAR324 cluster bacterium TaxID=2024889 RepID=A0A2A4SV81_9DELT|nr:MAG: phospho-N-acetylmuramoyl-pentapeptide-transferase [SAR324 cluster bacterium]
MLAEFLYYLFPYQIFESVFFRGGMVYLTTYILINWVMPKVIRLFRKKGITSDFKKNEETPGPYQGATPIMGGLVLVPAIILSTLLWAWMNQYTLAIVLIMFGFAVVGGIDDGAKVLHKRRVESGLQERKSYADKADGISGRIRLSLQFAITLSVIGGMYYFGDGISSQLHVPMVPMKTWFPELSLYLFIPLVTIMIVGGANAVNLTDGLDSLVTVPIMTCAFFVAAAAYIAGDLEWSERLKISFISGEIKEVSIMAIAIIAAGIAFLKFNAPPASIYMGDIGSLGLGAGISTMFLFAKAELYLPIVGGIFVLAAISSIIQRLWFKIALKKKGRAWAEKNRFFYRAPYHHHSQELITYREEDPEVKSVWHYLQNKMGWKHIADEDKYLSKEQVNNKVIWGSHLRSISLLVITLIIYFKVR